MRNATKKSASASPRQAVEPHPLERFEVLLEEIRDDVKALLKAQSVFIAKLHQCCEELRTRKFTGNIKLDVEAIRPFR